MWSLDGENTKKKRNLVSIKQYKKDRKRGTERYRCLIRVVCHHWADNRNFNTSKFDWYMCSFLCQLPIAHKSGLNLKSFIQLCGVCLFLQHCGRVHIVCHRRRCRIEMIKCDKWITCLFLLDIVLAFIWTYGLIISI